MNPIRRTAIRLLQRLPKRIRWPIQERMARKSRRLKQLKTPSTPIYNPKATNEEEMQRIVKRVALKEPAPKKETDRLVNADRARIKTATNADIARRLLRKQLLGGISKQFNLTRTQDSLLSRIIIHR